MSGPEADGRAATGAAVSRNRRVALRHDAGECGLAVLDRASGRVLLVDARDRMLLFRGCDPSRPEDGTWWFTPGGGIEAGESPLSAARRELAEETGITDAGLVGPIVRRRVEFDFEAWHVCSDEWFFLARVPACDIAPLHVTEIEARSVLGHRWWSLDELAATAEVVYVPAADLLAGWLAGRLPDGVVEVTQ